MDPRIRKTIGVLSGVVLVAVLVMIFWWPPAPTIVLVIRHAERNDGAPACTPATIYMRANPPLALDTAGESPRAKALAHVAGEAGLAAIYAGEFCRTQQTVQPLATQIGLAVTVVNQFAVDGSVNVDDVVTQIKSHKGKVVLVAGHTNTVPVIIDKLGGGTITAIPEDDFDNMYVVRIPRWLGKTKVVRLKYRGRRRLGHMT